MRVAIQKREISAGHAREVGRVRRGVKKIFTVAIRQDDGKFLWKCAVCVPYSNLPSITRELLSLFFSPRRGRWPRALNADERR